MPSLFPDVPVTLLARSSTTGPVDLAADLRAAGMLAASWQVEAMQDELADLREDQETAGNNFDEATSQAEHLADALDTLDGEMHDTINEAEDAIEALDLSADELRNVLRTMIGNVEKDRERLQSLTIDARGITAIDTAKEARELAAKEAKRQVDKAEAERKYQAEVTRANVATGQAIRQQAKARRSRKAS